MLRNLYFGGAIPNKSRMNASKSMLNCDYDEASPLEQEEKMEEMRPGAFLKSSMDLDGEFEFEMPEPSLRSKPYVGSDDESMPEPSRPVNERGYQNVAKIGKKKKRSKKKSSKCCKCPRQEKSPFKKKKRAENSEDAFVFASRMFLKGIISAALKDEKNDDKESE